jgi:hypothetical protein
MLSGSRKKRDFALWHQDLFQSALAAYLLIELGAIALLRRLASLTPSLLPDLLIELGSVFL